MTSLHILDNNIHIPTQNDLLHTVRNNQGMQKVVKRLKKRCENKNYSNGIVGINIGKNAESKLISKDYVDCMKSLGKYSDYIVINISSPNTPGLRNLQNRQYLESLIIELKKSPEWGFFCAASR